MINLKIKKKNIYEGGLGFTDDKSKETFDSLTRPELVEFLQDLGETIKNLKIKMKQANEFQGQATTCQRLSSDRHFISIQIFDLTPKQPPFVIIDMLSEVSIDEYLDFWNEQKNKVSDEFTEPTKQ